MENGQLRANVAELQADVASLAAENAALKDKLARLERLISRNSGNSSMAPSGDDQPGAHAAEGQAARDPQAQAGQAARRTGRAPGLER